MKNYLKPLEEPVGLVAQINNAHLKVFGPNLGPRTFSASKRWVIYGSEKTINLFKMKQSQK